MGKPRLMLVSKVSEPEAQTRPAGRGGPGEAAGTRVRTRPGHGHRASGWTRGQISVRRRRAPGVAATVGKVPCGPAAPVRSDSGGGWPAETLWGSGSLAQSPPPTRQAGPVASPGGAPKHLPSPPPQPRRSRGCGACRTGGCAHHRPQPPARGPGGARRGRRTGLGGRPGRKASLRFVAVSTCPSPAASCSEFWNPSHSQE